MMAVHPIIFSTDMVIKILTCANCGTITIEIKCPKCGSKDRLKTQTRRVINPQPTVFDRVGIPDWACLKNKWEVGDTLWVREAWSFIGTGWSSQEPNQETIYVGYKADNSRRDIVLPYDPEKGELCNGLKTPGQINPYGETTDREAYLDWQRKWWEKQKNKSARFMFRWAARIFLEITNIRVERVQDISTRDCWAEGLQFGTGATYQGIVQMRNLWDSLNAKRGYGWDKNPFVWVIEFKKDK